MTQYAEIKTRMALIGAILVIMMMSGVIAIFGLHYTGWQNAQDQDDLQSLYEGMDNVRAVQLHFKRQVQEWKNILLRGDQPKDFAQYCESFRKEQNRTTELLQNVQKPEERIKELTDRLKVLNQRYTVALAGFDPSQTTSARATDAQVRGLDRPLEHSLDTLVQEMEAEVKAQQQQTREAEQQRYRIFRNVLVVSSTMGCLLGLALLPALLRKKSGD